MIIKLIAVVTALCIAEITMLGVQSPSDPLFLFISDSTAVALARLLLIAALVLVAFKTRFTYRLSRYVAAGVGVLLLVIGIVGTVSQAFIDNYGGYIKAFDTLLFLDLGLVFCLAAASYNSAGRPLSLSRFRLRRIIQPMLVKPNAELAPIGRKSRRTISAKGS